VWTIFEAEFRHLWQTDGNDQWPSAALRDKYLIRLLQDAAGFGACKMMRRILGLAHVPDLDSIEDDHARATAESIALNIALAWLMDRHEMGSVDDLISAISVSKPSYPFV
jgi:5-methylthioribose kinase